MKVYIKKFGVDMQVKNRAIELAVYSEDDKEHLGDLVINKANLIWCPGQTRPKKGGIAMHWVKSIEDIEHHGNK
jgi:hypothetical protein